MSCVITNKPHPKGTNKRTCRECKKAAMRGLRQRKKGYDKAWWRKIKGSPMDMAKSLIYCAVRKGWLPPLKTLKCMDCSAMAQVWDHRDYKHPLYVQPVCRSCNAKRGPGQNKGTTTWNNGEQCSA